MLKVRSGSLKFSAGKHNLRAGKPKHDLMRFAESFFLLVYINKTVVQCISGRVTYFRVSRHFLVLSTTTKRQSISVISDILFFLTAKGSRGLLGIVAHL